jgi:hypothetical protein
MIPVLCSAPACKTIVRDGHARCELHRKTQKTHANKVRAEQRKEQSREKSFIYNTAAWKRLSIKKRTVDPFCEDCLERSPVVYKQADVVDHIVLCHSCHARKTANEKNRRKSEKRKKDLKLF